MTRFIFVLPTIILLSIVTRCSFATDLTPKKLIPSELTTLTVNKAVPLTVTVGNINKLDAPSFSIRLTIYYGDTTSGIISYNETITGLSIPKYSEKDFTFPKSFIPPVAGTYSAVIEVMYIDDINLSNNKLISSLHATTAFQQADDAADLLLDYLKSLFPLSDSARQAVMMLDKPLPIGTKIKSFDSTELNITITTPTWLGWYRKNKFERYSSVNGVVLMSDKDSIRTYFPARWWVTVNDTSIDELIDDSDFVYGSAPPKYIVDTPTISSSQVATAPTTECAIIVSGRSSNPDEQYVFNNDLNIVSVNLQQEKLGPHLTAENIIILYAPSPAEIERAFDSLKGKCTKLWFYYSGHGDSLLDSHGDPFGYMVTRDSGFAYWKLYNKLFESGANETTVIIDACHSGVAVEELKKDSRLESHNINVITACQIGETSKTYYTEGGYGFGGFTLYWFKCFGDPSAESDGVPGISEQEATDCLRALNPEFPNGQHMFETFHPRSIFHKVVPEQPVNTPTPVPQTSVTVTLREGASDKPLSVSVTDAPEGYFDFPVQNLNDSLTSSISHGRLWGFSYGPSSGYKMDLEFQTLPGIDSFSNGTPGILHREDSTKPWSVYTPYYFNSSKKTITALGVEKFSQWVMGSVNKPQAGVTQSAITPTSLRVCPNISRGSTTIRLSLATTDNITVTVYDMLGKKQFVAATGVFPAGEFTLPISTASYASGLYIVEVTSGSSIQLASAKFQVM